MRRSLACFLLLFVTLCATSAGAQEVVLARTAGDQTIANRIVAELRALGFNVHIVAEAESAELISLRQIAAGRGAIVGLRASPSKTGIELWIANPNTGATAFEEVVTVDSGRNDELLALRAVEVLRARLLRLGVRSPAVPEPPPAPMIRDAPPIQAPPQVVALEHPFLSADLGVSYTHDPSALSDHESVRLGLGFTPDAYWSVRAFSLIPIREATLDSEVGTVKTESTLFALSADARIQQDRFAGFLGAGLALALFDVEGQAEFPFEGQRQRLFAMLPFLRLGGSAELAERVLMEAELLGGFTAPRTSIRMNDEVAATWGRPLLIASLCLRLEVLSIKR